MRKRCLLILIAAILLFSFFGCGQPNREAVDAAPQALSDFDGRRIGVLTGSTAELRLKNNFPNAEGAIFASYPDMVLALAQGKIDAAIGDEVTLKTAILGKEGLTDFPELLEDSDCYFLLAKTAFGEQLQAQWRTFLTENRASGELERLQDLWFYGAESDKPVPNTDLPDVNGTIRVALCATKAPFEYVRDNVYVGYDLALLSLFCEEYGYKPVLSDMKFDALITAVGTGKSDMALGCFGFTEERQEVVNFSEPTCSSGVVIVYRQTADGSAGANAGNTIDSVDDLAGRNIGVKTGTTFDALTTEWIPDAKKLYYNSTSDIMQALLSEKIDAFLADMPQAKVLASKHPRISYLKEPLAPDSYGFAFAKTDEGAALRDQLNSYIERITADGTLQKMDDTWFGSDESVKVAPDYSALSAENGTLQYATDGTTEPFDYMISGEYGGYGIDILYGFCEENGYGLSVSAMDFAAVIPSLISGKTDIAGSSLSITDERKQSVYFSVPNYAGGVAVVIRAEDAASADNAGFFASLAASFEKTFIREGRYKLILSGLGVTLVISVLSAVFGTVLGFGLCLVRRSKRRALAGIAAAFIRIIQGIPSVVLLMVLYFVVFASANISGVIIAAIGFSINFGVYVSEMMRSGIDAVDRGQWEAADALGFGRAKTFEKVIAPQAIKHILPVYRGELISMVKMTSVVGYIAIQDLTKASDIIRSRTYEAFFPLIVTAIIYFLLAWGLTQLLSFVELRTDPLKRSRAPRGVDMTPAAAAERQSGQPAADANKDVIIRIEHLKKAYPNVTPLSDVNADIRRGDVVTVIGPSGTGKSTLLRCLNRLETPTSGDITVFDTDMGQRKTDIGAIRQRMGMVFQSFNLFPHLTVAENIMLAPVELKGVTRQAAYETALRLLRSVGLAEKALNYPEELSGGQKQRVAIARALAMNPDIVLFDEPTSALDPTMVGEVLSVIRKLVSEGLTMLIVTHEMKFARDVSTRVFYMDEGVIYEQGAPDALFDHPQRDKTRAFVRRLKVMETTLRSPDYDFIAVNEALQSFGQKHQFASGRIIDMQRVFEELIAQCVIPRLGAAFELHASAEYSEESDTLEMRFIWAGTEYDPLTEGDDISLQLVKPIVQNSTFRYADGINRLYVMLR